MSYALAKSKADSKVPENTPVPATSPSAAEPVSVSNNELLAARVSRAVNSGQAQSIAVGALSLCFGILLWHLATLYNFNFFINFENIPSPVKVANAFFVHLTEPVFYTHILVSIRRILIAWLYCWESSPVCWWDVPAWPAPPCYPT